VGVVHVLGKLAATDQRSHRHRTLCRNQHTSYFLLKPTLAVLLLLVLLQAVLDVGTGHSAARATEATEATEADKAEKS
jgi:hypothetical protein